MTTLTVIGILLIAETILTVVMMEMIIKILLSLPSRNLRRLMYKFVNNMFVAFLLDTAISVFMTAFTGSSVIAGTANLVASILAAVVLPGRIDRKFKHLVDVGVPRNKSNQERIFNEKG